MKSRGIALAMVVVALLALVGCGQPQQAAPAAPAKPTGLSGTVTYYTSMPEANVTQLIAAFKKVQPNVQINLYRAATGTVLAKLDAEIKAGNVVADSFSVAEPDAAVIMKERGQLLQFTPKGAEKLAQAFKDKDAYFYSFGLTNMVLVYNTEKVKDKPKGYADLLNPTYKGKVAIGDAASSGAMAHFVGTLLQNGFGWDYFEKLKENGVIIVAGPSDVAQKVATGEALLGITQDATARQLKSKGSPVDYVLAAEGSVLKNTNIQIMKATKNKEAAIAWVEFLLSAETQQLIADNEIMTPVLPGVKLPASLDDPANVKAMKIDDAAIAKNSTEIKQKFSALFGGTK